MCVCIACAYCVRVCVCVRMCEDVCVCVNSDVPVGWGPPVDSCRWHSEVHPGHDHGRVRLRCAPPSPQCLVAGSRPRYILQNEVSKAKVQRPRAKGVQGRPRASNEVSKVQRPRAKSQGRPRASQGRVKGVKKVSRCQVTEAK